MYIFIAVNPVMPACVIGRSDLFMYANYKHFYAWYYVQLLCANKSVITNVSALT